MKCNATISANLVPRLCKESESLELDAVTGYANIEARTRPHLFLIQSNDKASF